MKCWCCDLILSNDPMDTNFGLWTTVEPRLAYCAPPEPWHMSAAADDFCERQTLAHHLEVVRGCRRV